MSPGRPGLERARARRAPVSARGLSRALWGLMKVRTLRVKETGLGIESPLCLKPTTSRAISPPSYARSPRRRQASHRRATRTARAGAKVECSFLMGLSWQMRSRLTRYRGCAVSDRCAAPHNNAMNPTVRPVTRLATSFASMSSNGHAQGARPSRPAGYRERYADLT